MKGQSYVKEDVIRQIYNFYNQHGRIVVRDLKSANNLPTIAAITYFWGSFQNCLRDLGIFQDSYCFNRKCKTDKQMLDELSVFTNNYLKEHLYLPTEEVVDLCKEISSVSTYTKRFGGLKNAYALIGYSDDFNHKQFLSDIKRRYIEYCNKYGRILNSRDITNICKTNEMYAVQTIIDNFGSLSEFQRECGFTPTRIGRSIKDEEALDLLIRLRNELGRVPLQDDVDNCNWIPSSGYYHKRFGSYKNALKAIGLNSTKTYESMSGVKCNSQYELKIANSLEKHKIVYEKELMYKSVIPNFTKSYRFDFAFEYGNEKYYIEFFGITGIQSYDDKTKEKIELCNNNSINLISLFPDDIYGKTYDDIYNLIKNKCKRR